MAMEQFGELAEVIESLPSSEDLLKDACLHKLDLVDQSEPLVVAVELEIFQMSIQDIDLFDFEVV